MKRAWFENHSRGRQISRTIICRKCRGNQQISSLFYRYQSFGDVSFSNRTFCVCVCVCDLTTPRSCIDGFPPARRAAIGREGDIATPSPSPPSRGMSRRAASRPAMRVGLDGVPRGVPFQWREGGEVSKWLGRGGEGWAEGGHVRGERVPCFIKLPSADPRRPARD